MFPHTSELDQELDVAWDRIRGSVGARATSAVMVQALVTARLAAKIEATGDRLDANTERFMKAADNIQTSLDQGLGQRIDRFTEVSEAGSTSLNNWTKRLMFATAALAFFAAVQVVALIFQLGSDMNWW